MRGSRPLHLWLSGFQIHPSSPGSSLCEAKERPRSNLAFRSIRNYYHELAMLLHRVILAFACVVFAGGIGAAELPVTNANDSGAGSLRQRILEANPAGGDTVVFQIPIGPGYDPVAGVFTIGLTSGELVIDKSLTIDGSAQKILVTRSAASSARPFNVTSGPVTIANLTI